MTHDPTDTHTSSRASVTTSRASRYGKQLASHMGRTIPFTWDAETATGSATFAEGAVAATITGHQNTLDFELTGPAHLLDKYEHALGGHLVRFGQRENLECNWARANGQPGTTQSSADEQ